MLKDSEPKLIRFEWLITLFSVQASHILCYPFITNLLIFEMYRKCQFRVTDLPHPSPAAPPAHRYPNSKRISKNFIAENLTCHFAP